MTQIFAETTRYPSRMGEYFNFFTNNTFYLLAPDYYLPFYSIYLNNCLSIYDGTFSDHYQITEGYMPQKMLQSVVRGLGNTLFAFGIDFTGNNEAYNFITKWAKDAKLLKNLKKCFEYSGAGGKALLKLNKKSGDLFVTAHRIDTYFADVDNRGNVQSIRIYLDSITNTNPDVDKKSTHYCICEERYFNEHNIPCVKAVVYPVQGTIQSEVLSRSVKPRPANWEELPRSVKKFIKTYYPSIVIGKEQWLPYKDKLGCEEMYFTSNIPQMPNMPFGQPIADIAMDLNFQYDQLEYFSKNEVDLARARALISNEMWNKDDPDYDSDALSERFYQAVNTVESEPIQPIQFNLRSNDIKLERENILKNLAFRLNVSASTLASFLDDGQGAMTATQIISEKTKTDTWIKSQIQLIKPELDDLLEIVCRYYGIEPCEIVIKAQDQVPFLDKLKVYSDALTVGNMSPKQFVKRVYGDMSEAEQQEEIEYLIETKEQQKALQNATMSSWNK